MPQARPRLRRARRGESDAAAEIFYASRKASEPENAPLVHDLGEIRGWMREVVFAGCDVTVAVDADDLPIALLAQNGTLIELLYVAPGHTGAGIGTAMLEHARKGRDELELWTFQANLRAIAFYERHGFKALRRTDGENEERAPDVLMHWTR